MTGIRNSAKAIIRREDTVLMIRCQDEMGEFYILPGGGQQPGETMSHALLRECVEELGCLVEVGELRFVCEYIHRRRTATWQRSLHQLEFMFLCALPPGAEPSATGGTNPDDIQVGVEWVPIRALEGPEALRHYPRGLPKALRNPESTPAYWGNVR